MRKTMIAGLAGVAGLGAMLAIGIAGLGIAADTQRSVTGNLEDTFCYTVVGAHGASRIDAQSFFQMSVVTAVVRADSTLNLAWNG